MTNASTKSKGDRVREWVQFALLVFASTWGIYTFVYKEIVVPSRRPASLTISGELDELGRVGDLVLVRARVHASNRKDSRIYAPALWFTATGLDIGAKRSVNEEADIPEEDGDALGMASHSNQRKHVVASWRLRGWETWYEPGDETTNDYLFYVPVNRYQAIQLKVEVIVAKSIDGLGQVNWNSQTGVFTPTIMMKRPGNATEPYDTFNPAVRRHTAWEKKNGVGHNWSVATLSLLSSTEAK